MFVCVRMYRIFLDLVLFTLRNTLPLYSSFTHRHTDVDFCIIISKGLILSQAKSKMAELPSTSVFQRYYSPRARRTLGVIKANVMSEYALYCVCATSAPAKAPASSLQPPTSVRSANPHIVLCLELQMCTSHSWSWCYTQRLLIVIARRSLL